jgi:SMC interacting uncharacterized protein involved in chromosome segregation
MNEQNLALIDKYAKLQSDVRWLKAALNRSEDWNRIYLLELQKLNRACKRKSNTTKSLRKKCKRLMEFLPENINAKGV